MKGEFQASFPFDKEKSLTKDRLLDQMELQRPLIFFDLETTGLDTKNDRIIQFAFLRIDPERSLREWMELINPGVPIPPAASRVHHITNEMVRDKPDFSHFAPAIKEFVAECDLAGFNVVRFDLPFLAAEMERHGYPLDLKQHHLIDAQVIFHKHEPRDLSAAYRFYCKEDHADAHDALADARATCAILNAQLARYDDLPKNLEGLHEYCAPAEGNWVTPDRKLYWRNGEAIISFGKHKGRSLQWLHENNTDYLHWMLGSDFAEETKAIVEAAIRGTFPKKEEAEAAGE
jgi:DNA polymerase-3 subunit epsilon